MVSGVRFRYLIAALVVAVIGATVVSCDTGAARSQEAYCAMWQDFTRRAESPFDLALSEHMAHDLERIAPKRVAGQLRAIERHASLLTDTAEQVADDAEAPSQVTQARADAVTGIHDAYVDVAEFTAKACYRADDATSLRDRHTLAELEAVIAICDTATRTDPIEAAVWAGETTPADGFAAVAAEWDATLTQIDPTAAMPRDGATALRSAYRNLARTADRLGITDMRREPADATTADKQTIAGAVEVIDETLLMFTGGGECDLNPKIVDHYNETGELILPQQPA